MDEIYDSITSCNLITDMFLNEDTEHYDVFEEHEASEFIVGFSSCSYAEVACQNDETIEPYLSLVKTMYKDLVNVQKRPPGNDVHVSSSVFMIDSVAGRSLFPNDDSPHNACFVVVDPLSRTATFFSFAFVAWW